MSPRFAPSKLATLAAAREEAARGIRAHANSVEPLAPAHADYLRALPARVWGIPENPHTTPSIAEVAASWED